MRDGLFELDYWTLNNINEFISLLSTAQLSWLSCYAVFVPRARFSIINIVALQPGWGRNSLLTQVPTIKTGGRGSNLHHNSAHLSCRSNLNTKIICVHEDFLGETPSRFALLE